MKHNKLFSTLILCCFLSITLLTESRAQVVVQNFDNAVGTFFPDPPTTNQDFFASNPSAVFDLSNYSSDSYEGSGSMKLDYAVGYDAGGGWIVRTTYNALSGNTSLPYIDLSSGQFLRLWYKVLIPASLTEPGTINFEFKLAEFNDTGDRELWQYITSLDLTDNSGTWENVTIPLKQNADITKGFILQLGYIDGVLQLDKIKGFEIAVSYQTTGIPATTPIGTGSLLLDNLQLLGSYNIYTVNVKTGNVERITFLDDADEYNPSFNNNGKLVAHDVVSSSDPLGQSIYITDLKTHTSIPLVGAEGGNDASWSPDGKYIAFDRDGNIYVVPSGGGTATLVRENAVDAEWSNNSKHLVFTDLSDYTLRTIDVNSGSETNLGVQGVNASWSQNGKSIAYSDYSNIFTISVDEAGEPQGSPVQLTSSGAGEFSQQPSWSNNGKTIVFHSNQVTGDVDIWTIPSPGGTPTLLTGNSDYGDYDPCYSKNGKYVAYARFTEASFSLPKRNFDNNESSFNENPLPNKFTLDQNFPNPFNPTTQIRFGIPEAGNVTLKIYNSVGQLVKTLIDGNMSEGFHQVTWDATNNNGSKLSSGVYFYRITAGTFTQINKMLLLK